MTGPTETLITRQHALNKAHSLHNGQPIAAQTAVEYGFEVLSVWSHEEIFD